MKKVAGLIFFLLLSQVFIPNCLAEVKSQENLDDYLSYFYNRYSQNFDQNGIVFKTPGYGVTEYRAPKTAREILSLALYYKYRALNGDEKAKKILRDAVVDANNELDSRPAYTQSFSDAFAQMTMLQLLDEFPSLLNDSEKNSIYSGVVKRIGPGIAAKDSSNRAALSAVYWQAAINNLRDKKIISLKEYNNYSKLIFNKIKKVTIVDVTTDGWYLEGSPMSFNPHYHLITAMALVSYGELSGRYDFLKLSAKMVKNLRTVTFSNGMIEARIGGRPVGLGAQFYLGTGLLNDYFGYSDYNTYFDYARGDRFFSDADRPNRLEYHSTILNTAPIYHDDISFSNLAELAILTPFFKNIKIDSGSALTISSYSEKKGGRYLIANFGNQISFKNLLFKQDATGGYTSISKK